MSNDNELQVTISAQDDTGHGFDAAKQAMDSFVSGVERGSAQIGDAKSSFTGLGEAASEAGEHMAGMSARFVDFAAGGRIVSERIAEMIAEFLALREAMRFITEGIEKGDAIRDLSLSLGVFTGSVQKGTEAMEFFDRQADNTRNTGEQLATVFRDVLPQAISKGFSQETMANITVWLSQLGTISGQSLDAMEHGFQRLLSGQVTPGRNPLLKVLGITKDQVKDLGWDFVIEKMQEISGHFPEFGQSFESTMMKAKESLVIAFGEGFNEARGSTEKGMAGILNIVRSPDVQNTFKSFGQTVAEIGPQIVSAFNASAGAVQMLIGGFETAIGLSLQFTTKALETYLSMPATIAAGMPAWMKKSLSIGFGIDVDAAASLQSSITEGAIRTLHDASATGGTWAEGGADTVREGMAKLNAAINSADMGVATSPLGKLTLTDEQRAELERLGRIASENAEKTAKYTTELIRANTTLKEHIDIIKQKGEIEAAGNSILKDDLEYQLKLTEASNAHTNALEKYAEAFKKLGDTNPLVIAVKDSLQQLNEVADAAARSDFMKALFSHGVNPNLAMINPGLDQQTLDLAHMRQIGQTYKDATEEAMKGLVKASERSLQVWNSELGNIFISAAEGGAKGFMSAMEGDFHRLTSEGGKALAQYLSEKMGLGTRGDPLQLDAAGKAQDSRFYYDAAGNKVKGGAGNFQQGLDYAAIGVGAYGQASSSTGPGSGSLASGTVSGAVSGFATAGIYGAIAGAIIGYIGSALGEQAAKDKWKYFQLGFNPDGAGPTGAGGFGWGVGSGAISLRNVNNLNSDEQAQVLAQIYTKFDSVKDSMVDLTFKLGEIVPKFDLSKLTGVSSAPGEPAYGPRSSFMSDFNAWLANTLPKEVEAQYTSVVASGFERLGLSSEKFRGIWDALDKIDPTKTVQLLGQLADALNSIDQSMSAFTDSGSFGGLAGLMGSHFTQNIQEQLSMDKGQSYAQRLAGTRQMNLSGGGYLPSTGDQSILDFAGNIHNKSIEGQIADEATLAGMLKTRYDAEKAMVTEIFNLAQSAKQQYEGDIKSLTLQGMLKSDGTPDYAAQRAFLQNSADSDLAQLRTAHNATEAGTAYNQYVADIKATAAAGLSSATTVEDKKKILDWEKENLGIGQGELQGKLSIFGDEINKQNDIFTKELVPALKDLTGAITGVTGGPTGVPIGGGGNHPPKNQDPGFSNVVTSVNTGSASIVAKLDSVIAAINAIAIPAPASSGGSSGFIDRTRAGRAA